MKHTIYLNGEQERALKEYRERRRTERGKVIQTATALTELFERALSGFEPSAPMADRVSALEAKVEELQWASRPDWQRQVQHAIDKGATKIDAIKLCRNLTSLGLKEAKDEVELIWPNLSLKNYFN